MGMEVYNVAIKMGFHLQNGGLSSMTNVVFWEAMKEALYMGLFVFLFSSLWGNRLGAAFAAATAIRSGIIPISVSSCARAAPWRSCAPP